MQAARLLGFLLVIYVAFTYGPSLADFLSKYIQFPKATTESTSWFAGLPTDALLTRLVAFAILVLLTKYIVNLLANTMNKFMNLPGLNTVNRVAGVALALVQMTIILLLVLNTLNLLSGPKMESLLHHSFIASWLLAISPKISEWLIQWTTGLP